MHIKFQDYEEAAKVVKKKVNEYCTAYTDYLKIMEEIGRTAMMSGTASETLTFVNTQLKRAVDIPEGLPEQVDQLVENFLNCLHEAQVVQGASILYDRDFKALRDYSDAFFVGLSGSVEAPDYDASPVWDWIEDHVVAWFFEKFGWNNTSTQKNLKDAQANLLQFKDVTKRRLLMIKNDINEIKARYASYFGSVAETLNTLNEYLYVMQEIFQNYCTSGQGVTAEQMALLNTQYNAMMESYNNVLIEDIISDEEVEAFITTDLASTFQDQHIQIIYDACMEKCNFDFSDYEYWKLILFQLFNIAEGQIKSNGDLDIMIAKTEVLGVLEDVSKSFNYDETKMNDVVDFAKDIVGYIKKYGKEWKKHYPDDKRLKKYRDTVQFFDKVDDFSKFLKYGEDGVEVLIALCTDYTKNQEFLNSIERYYEADGLMKEAFADVRALYEHELDAVVSEVGTKVAEYGVDALYSCSVGKIVGTIKKGIGFVGDVTEENARTAAQMQIIICGQDMLNMAENSLKGSIKALQGVSQGDELYETYMNDVKNSFQVYKSTMSGMYEKLAKIASGEERSYYYYCAREVTEMRLSDLGNTSVMTLEEYLNSQIVW